MKSGAKLGEGEENGVIGTYREQREQCRRARTDRFGESAAFPIGLDVQLSSRADQDPVQIPL